MFSTVKIIVKQLKISAMKKNEILALFSTCIGISRNEIEKTELLSISKELRKKLKTELQGNFSRNLEACLKVYSKTKEHITLGEIAEFLTHRPPVNSAKQAKEAFTEEFPCLARTINPAAQAYDGFVFKKHFIEISVKGKNQMDPLWAYVATNAAGNLHYVVSKNRSIIDIFDGDEVKVIK